MEPWQIITTTLGAIGALGAAVIAFRKSGPESTQIIVESAAGSVKTASALRDDMREDLDALRGDFADYRRDTDARLAELASQLRGEKAERQSAVRRAVAAEQRAERAERKNRELRDRVANLEAEVARLKRPDVTT